RIRDVTKTDLVSGENALLHHELSPLPQTFPEFFSHEDDWEWSNFPALDEGSGLEEFVECSQTTGHDDERARVFDQTHFAREEIAKFQAAIDVRIFRLLVWEDNIETVALAAGFVSAAIGSLHDSGAAARQRREAGFGQFLADGAGQLVIGMRLSKAGRPKHRHGRSHVIEGLKGPIELRIDSFESRAFILRSTCGGQKFPVLRSEAVEG